MDIKLCPFSEAFTSAAVNVCVRVFLWTPAFHCLGTDLGVEPRGPVTIPFNWLRNKHSFFAFFARTPELHLQVSVPFLCRPVEGLGVIFPDTEGLPWVKLRGIWAYAVVFPEQEGGLWSRKRRTLRVRVLGWQIHLEIFRNHYRYVTFPGVFYVKYSIPNTAKSVFVPACTLPLPHTCVPLCPGSPPSSFIIKPPALDSRPAVVWYDLFWISSAKTFFPVKFVFTGTWS